MKKISLFLTLIVSFLIVSTKCFAVDTTVSDKICVYQGVAMNSHATLDSTTPTVYITADSESFIIGVYFKDVDGTQLGDTARLGNKMTTYYHEIDDYKERDGKIIYGTDKIRTKFLQDGTCPPYVFLRLQSTSKSKVSVISKVEFPSTAPSYCTQDPKLFDWNYAFCSVTNVTVATNLLQYDFKKNYSLDSKTCPDAYKNEKYVTYLTETMYYLLQKNGNKELMNIAQYKYLGNIAKDVTTKFSKGGACVKTYESASQDMKDKYGKLFSYSKQLTSFVGDHNTAEDPTVYPNKCQYILGDPSKEGDFAYYLDMTFRFIKFLAPVILIVMSIIDYVKVIATSDADALKKVNKKTITRIIFTLLIFVLPILISLILNILGLQGRCDFPNINGL